MFHKKTPQHMPIFKSEQGVGKSTIISILGLSWAEEIKTLAGKSNSEKLEIANKRELNAVLEFAEMSRFTTTSIEENKSAITVREEQLML
ncbi:VapE domain-containing protein, partial [Leuconostoc mesenteroides]|uniref:VapE domain-containing protein n=1 Tax=Leuconostoc mesenteroides TaxID=1245 RepID=UPI002362F077